MARRAAVFRRGVVRPAKRRRLPPQAVLPTGASAPLVEVVAETLTVTVQKRATTPLVETVVEVLPVTVTKRVTVGLVEVVVEARGVVGQPRTVSVLVEVLPVKVTKIARLGVVDVVADVRPVAAGATRAPLVDVVVDVLPVTVSYGGTGVSRTGLPPVIFLPTTRVIAQSILTGEFLHWELPVRDLEITWSLSGPTSITGSFEPEIRDLRNLNLMAHGTWLHVEDSGLIRASGILQPGQADDQRLSVEALGPSHYARQIPYRGTFSQIGVDPAAVVKHLWQHIQSYPTGNLGVQVNGTTPVRLGTEPSEQVDFVTGAGDQVSFDRGGPYRLDYFENTSCGKEIDDLAGETPFDYIERAQWNADKTDVEHHIDIGYPQIGTRRTDLRFADGENVLESAPVEEPDGVYADQVFVHGRGEGASAVTGYAGTVIPGRLRMPVVVVDKTIGSKERADARAAEELAARLSALVEVSEIAVSATHANAPLGSFGPGDEIQPDLVLPHVGRIRAWHRVTGVRFVAERGAAVLALTRRGEFASR